MAGLGKQSRRVEPDRRRLEELLWALEAFSLRGWIPLRYITTFLMVALDEGNYPSAYARRAGVDRMSMSRYLRDIGAESRTGGPGLGLVKVVPDADHPPRQKVLLTEKGRALLLRATALYLPPKPTWKRMPLNR